MDTSKLGIYIIANTESGKVYVGSSVNLRQRWFAHKSDLHKDKHHNPHLQYAWNKYGEDTFEFMVCEYIEDKEQLYIREQYWLDFHRMLTEVYNCGLVSRNPMLGGAHSKEARRKISEVHKGRDFSEEHRRKLSAARKGRVIRALPYPAFIHKETGRILPAGVNLSAICREEGLCDSCMYRVKTGEDTHHKGWFLVEPT